ncbi:hypothetical protein DFH06DRAFT_1468461, partial [Mycena polygramma]
MTVSPYIQRQLRVARRGVPLTGVAETSAQMDEEPMLEQPPASPQVDLRSLKATRRQGVSDPRISSLFSLAEPDVGDWRFAHVPRDSDSDSLSAGAGGADEEGEVFEFPRPPTVLGALSPPSRYLPLHSHSQNSSVDSAWSRSSVGSRTPPSGGSDDSSHSGNWASGDAHDIWIPRAATGAHPGAEACPDPAAHGTPQQCHCPAAQARGADAHFLCICTVIAHRGSFSTQLGPVLALYIPAGVIDTSPAVAHDIHIPLHAPFF